MKRKRILSLILNDEAHLREIGRIHITPSRLAIGGIVFLFASILFGIIVVWATPVKHLLPGYLKESQRAASEEAMMRLDSLKTAYAQNEAYIKNITAVLNTERVPMDSLQASSHTLSLTPDSLLSASKEEAAFVNMMREREKYNLAVVAPLAAEGIMFYPLNEEAVFPLKSRTATKAEVIIAKGSVISSVADGTVLEVVSPDLNGNFSILVQHPKNFVSRLSGCGTPLVGEGDRVVGGQAIALAPEGSNSSKKVGIELWHNGTALLPYNYVSTHRLEDPDAGM